MGWRDCRSAGSGPHATTTTTTTPTATATTTTVTTTTVLLLQARREPVTLQSAESSSWRTSRMAITLGPLWGHITPYLQAQGRADRQTGRQAGRQQLGLRE